MRRTALLAVATIGFGCCVISFITARADLLGEAEIVAVPAHHMVGWKQRTDIRAVLTGNRFGPTP
jgi:hypothetical protein